MSIDNLSSKTNEPSSVEGSSVDYAQLRAEATEATPELKRAAERDPKLEDYEAAASRIRTSADYYQRQHVPLNEAIPDLKDIYCDSQDNQTQKAFNELMIDSIVAYRYQVMLDRLNSADTLDEVQRHARKQLTYRLCEYNHEVRDVVAAGRNVFDRPTISGLIAAAAGGSPAAETLGRRAVNGTAAELAVLDALTGMPEVGFAQFTNVEVDLRGVDIKIATDRGWAAIDVKANDAPSEPGWRNGQPYIKLHIDHSRLEDLTADEPLLKSLRSEIAENLDASYALQASRAAK